MTLIEFLTARLDEDEAAAKDAPVNVGCVPPAHWSVSAYGPDNGRVVMGTADDFALPTSEHAIHVARHDPARVLREVAAKRAILREHREEGRGDDRGCAGCGWAPGDEVRMNEIEECPTLSALAAVYSDHRHYQKDWAP